MSAEWDKAGEEFRRAMAAEYQRGRDEMRKEIAAWLRKEGGFGRIYADAIERGEAGK